MQGKGFFHAQLTQRASLTGDSKEDRSRQVQDGVCGFAKMNSHLECQP